MTWELGNKNSGQFKIFELPICDALDVLNFKSVGHEGQ